MPLMSLGLLVCSLKLSSLVHPTTVRTSIYAWATNMLDGTTSMSDARGVEIRPRWGTDWSSQLRKQRESNGLSGDDPTIATGDHMLKSAR